MRVVYQCCCGLDIHKKTVVACVITEEGKEIQTFGTITKDLLKLADWLLECGVSHVAMESTSFYWVPVYNLLEGMDFTLLVANARHIKAVPGRKTDVKDAEWIADLLRHGLLRGSYIPDRPQRELRELVRFRRSLIQQRAQAVNRIHKVLEGGNIKLSNVVTDVMGVSGRAMLEALVDGTQDPKAMASLAKGKLVKKEKELEEALHGVVGPHQRLLLGSLLRQLDFLDGEIDEMNQEVEKRMAPFKEALERVDTIPGIGRRLGEEILAETGGDMSRFPSAGHLASWAKVCPGNNESGGKRKSGSTGYGNCWLRSALVEAAWAGARTRNSYLHGKYHRLAARRGVKRAIMAVAHIIVVTMYHMLSRGTMYQEMGANYFDERQRQAAIRRSVQRIERLGYKVMLETA